MNIVFEISYLLKLSLVIKINGAYVVVLIDQYFAL